MAEQYNFDVHNCIRLVQHFINSTIVWCFSWKWRQSLYLFHWVRYVDISFQNLIILYSIVTKFFFLLFSLGFLFLLLTNMNFIVAKTVSILCGCYLFYYLALSVSPQWIFDLFEFVILFKVFFFKHSLIEIKKC